MIRLLREVDYNKSDKTFYFNDAANVARNVFTIHGECLEHILYIYNISTDKILIL